MTCPVGGTVLPWVVEEKVCPEEESTIATAQVECLSCSALSLDLIQAISAWHTLREATPVIMTPWKSSANSSYKHQTEER